MFIVVAIVIFGIFVSLSYTLFGKTLQPQIVGLFTDATEQVSKDLGMQNKKGILLEENPILLDQTMDGYMIPESMFKQDYNYAISFDITLDEGALNYIGGHNHIETTSNVKIDGVESKHVSEHSYNNDNWRFGVPFNTPFVVGQTKHVEFTFNASIKDKPSHNNANVYIHPNRIYGNGTNWKLNPTKYKATLTNIRLKETK